jgi:serine/threonine protein kinase
MGAAPSSANQPATTSMIGRRIHTYELVAVLGAGGMGRVYRARDSRLGRDVAIKLLPSAYKADPDRIARFEREAQVLAALKHPHIGAIYGLEETAEVTALVMELVEGEDLANRLARGPLPAHDALTIARQIADALDAAHELGIIHRDLKPANICLQRDGTVKVVDFGLAKPLLHGENTPTLPAISQAAGAVIGTPAYMSPEQARGDAAGREADVWAFGVVLYEMLTGRSPFSRPTTAETLACVLSAPADERLLPLDTPASVRRLIRRCLVKDPKRRIRHMGDVRNELDEALSAPST